MTKKFKVCSVLFACVIILLIVIVSLLVIWLVLADLSMVMNINFSTDDWQIITISLMIIAITLMLIPLLIDSYAIMIKGFIELIKSMKPKRITDFKLIYDTEQKKSV